MGVRWDSAGISWTEAPREKKKGGGSISRIRPPVPETGWQLPSQAAGDFREICGNTPLGIDIETCDPDLTDKGPGVRRDGRIVGVSLSTPDGWKRYFPFGHEEGPNLDADVVRRYISDTLAGTHGPLVGANLLYDFDYLTGQWNLGSSLAGRPWYDVQIAQPLINENAWSFSLDTLANLYLGVGKEDAQLYDWLALAFGGEATRRDQGKNIWRAPTALAGPYAESDASLPLQILAKQLPIIQAEELERVWSYETRLLPMLLAMRQRGVRVDVSGAAALDDRLVATSQRLADELKALGIDAWSGLTIADYCTRKGIPFPTTKAGTPSFVKNWLKVHADPNLKQVANVRRLQKLAGTFINSYILDNQINGRLHCQFHPLRTDEFGAVSGRFSSSHPNLQNIPIRDAELGKLIRSLWVPEEGEDWEKDDYSQIEFRLCVHYGKGPSAKLVQAQYRDDPTTDFHRAVAEWSDITRDAAKSINFGLVYGMGEPAMAANMGRTLQEVAPIFQKYHTTLPFIKEEYNDASNEASNKGFITMLSGRRRRFDDWEPTKIDYKDRKENPEKYRALPYEEAMAAYNGKVRRAFTHKALNARLQGGAADIIKKGMVQIWEAGCCDVLGAPLLQVHDELDWSVPRTAAGREARNEVRRILQNAASLRVPLVVESSEPCTNWGETKD